MSIQHERSPTHDECEGTVGFQALDGERDGVELSGDVETMMVAMMFATVARVVLLHRMVVRRRGEGIGPSVAFGSGHLMV